MGGRKRFFSLLSRSGRHRILRPLCHGKLPHSGDLLTWRGGEASEEFQGWVRQLGGPAVSQRDRLGRPQRVLFVPRGQDARIVASLWDSRDKVGRPCPFAIWFELPEVVPTPLCARLVAADRSSWEKLDGYYDTLSAAGGSEAFYEILRDLSSSAPAWPAGQADRDEVERRAASVPLGSFVTGAFGPGGVESWVRSTWRVYHSATRADGASSPSSRAWRLPLAASGDPVVEIEAWLHLFRRLRGGALPPCSLIFPRAAGRERASCSIFFRPLRESDVALLQERVGRAEVEDFEAGEGDGEGEGFPEFRRAALEWLEQPSATLWEMLPPAVLAGDEAR